MPGSGCALPGLRAVYARSVTLQTGQAQPARQRAAALAAAVGRPPARGDEKRQMEMVLCRLADNKINLRPGKDALAPGAGKPRPGFRC